MHSTSTYARAKTKSQMQSQFIAMSLTFWLQNSHTLDSFNHFLCEEDKKERRKTRDDRDETTRTPHIEWPAHSPTWTCNAVGLRGICFALFFCLQDNPKQKMNATKRKTGFTISLHSPSNVDVQLYFGSVLSRHAIYASSTCPYPARIVIRCSCTDRALIGRRKRLLCIAAASSSSACDAIGAVHFERV